MPDHYDRATCATELRLRHEILEKARGQNWKPAEFFQVPGDRSKKSNRGKTKSDNETSSVSSTSVTSTASFLKEEENIADLSQVVLDFDGSKGYV